MTIQTVRKNLIKEHNKSLKPSSKFYKEDKEKFVKHINSITDKETLTRMLNNIICLNGNNKAFNKEVVRITNQLERGGMFDIRKMKPQNALD